MKKGIRYALFLLPSLFLLGGLVRYEKKKSAKGNERLQIICTTAMIGDVVKHIVQGKAKVITLMKAGVDPHNYEATIKDAWHLTNADLIFFTGLHFEGEMHHNLAMLAKYKQAYQVSDALCASDLIGDPNFPKGKDPHIFWDPTHWAKVTRHICNLLKTLDPKNADLYEKNTQNYLQALHTLDQAIQEAFAQIPPQDRILITSHDAFSYFGRRYSIQIKPLQGISTVTEASANRRITMKRYILAHGIKALFVEYSVNPKGIQALQEDCKNEGHHLTTYALYSDTLGEESPTDTYLGALRYNAFTIIKGLRKHDQDTEKSH